MTLDRKALYLCTEEVAEARKKGFLEERMRPGWTLGQTIDVFGGPYDWGMTGTIVEVSEDEKRCVIELW